MAKLTDEQKQAITQWAADGATLNDIQARLKEDYSLVYTYFDTRLLVMELGVTLKDKKRDVPAPEPEPEPAASGNASEDPNAAFDDESGDDFASDIPPGGNSNVSVSLDTLAIPGTMVSGKATFSDAVTVSWYLDQQGRLGLRDAPPGYQPPPQDIQSFQLQLQKLLR
ncbi:hypothetical protein FEM03_22860 [Phragmitibacter flavus]|uniref:Uncharacterized protein n=1 Tax=Phragmitibacter flavus TaxID=2576071 RepID=A0A5R8K7X0_9BACT|nr:hypothetical protein [Phragmitibacter flavus]TLD68447.1 hypothetical protein FEM03_22860 [Phragmitibacter flavus]